MLKATEWKTHPPPPSPESGPPEREVGKEVGESRNSMMLLTSEKVTEAFGPFF